MQIFLRILFVISLCLLPLPVSASQIVGKVVSIADGDTITVLTEQAQQIKIRLYGIVHRRLVPVHASSHHKYSVSRLALRLLMLTAMDERLA